MKQFTLCLLLLTATFMAGEDNGPVFRTGSTLVSVPVVVTDKAGRPVNGLKQEDFHIAADGQTRPTATFERIHSGIYGSAQAVTSNHVRSNRSAANAVGQSRLTIIVFDGPNIDFSDQRRAREEMVNGLAAALPRGESVALLAITSNGLKVLHDFADDPKLLVASLKQLQGSGKSFREKQLDDARNVQQSTTAGTDVMLTEELQNSDQATLAGAGAGRRGGAGSMEAEAVQMQRIFESLTDHANFQNTTTTLDAMAHIAHAFEGIPGRKNLIWVTGGFPFTLMSNPLHDSPYASRGAALYREIFRTLNAANIAVYPLDVGSMTFSASAAFARPYRGANIVAPVYEMEQFADVTGGRMCYHRYNLQQCLNQAVDDSRDYYLLTFYAPETASGWKKLKVTVDTPQTTVHARTGYYYVNAKDQPKKTHPDDPKTELAAALTSPIEYPALPLAVRWDRVADGAVKVTILVEPGGAVIDHEKSDHLSIDFATLIVDSKGKPINDGYQRIEGDLLPDKAKLISSSGVSNDFTLKLPAGDCQVKIAVRDNISGKLGTVYVTVPNQETATR